MDCFKDEMALLAKHLSKSGKKNTRQRQIILQEFLQVEKHVSAEELLGILRRKDATIGQATVFRALKTFCTAGIAQPVEFADRIVRYEHKYNHAHHDHLICVNCGSVVEFIEKQIEEIQENVCSTHGFVLKYHRLQLFGTCNRCSKTLKDSTRVD
jgi:Fur family ferric uptake transcriptional regulator